MMHCIRTSGGNSIRERRVNSNVSVIGYVDRTCLVYRYPGRTLETGVQRWASIHKLRFISWHGWYAVPGESTNDARRGYSSDTEISRVGYQNLSQLRDRKAFWMIELGNSGRTIGKAFDTDGSD